MQPIINYFTNTPKTKLIIRLLILLFVLALLAIYLIFGRNYFVEQLTVTLNPSPGTTITIGEQNGEDLSIKKQIVSASSLKKINFQPGVYVIKFSGSKDYQIVTNSISITKSIEIKTPTLIYTQDKLGQLLTAEKSSIQSVITPVLPNSGYQVDNGTLFDNGQWYGANLKPGVWYNPVVAVKNIGPFSGLDDMLRIILKKENGKWKIAAGPSIIFSIDDYPNIPSDVIRATNGFGFY